jgi:hypothetical protein
VVAIAADTIGAPLGEVAGVVFDLSVALLLAALIGPKPFLLLAFVLEAIPIVGLFPTWIAAVTFLSRQGSERR